MKNCKLYSSISAIFAVSFLMISLPANAQDTTAEATEQAEADKTSLVDISQVAKLDETQIEAAEEAQPKIMNFGNLMEIEKVDENGEPILDKDGTPTKRKMTDEEVIASITQTMEPLLGQTKKLGKITVKPKLVRVVVIENVSNQAISTFEINRETGYLVSDEKVMKRREDTKKAILRSIERKQMLYDRLQKAANAIREKKKQREQDAQNKAE